MALGGISAAGLSPGLSNWRVLLVVVSAAFGVLGLVEDLRGVPSLQRLLAQGLIAVAALPLLVRDLSRPLPWRLLFSCGVLLWLVSYVNGAALLVAYVVSPRLVAWVSMSPRPGGRGHR